jgi:multiple sugar transport system substrate-binding protein
MYSTQQWPKFMAAAVAVVMLVMACTGTPSVSPTLAPVSTATPGATAATTPAPTGADTPAPTAGETPAPTATPVPTPISTFDPGIPRDQPGPNGGTVVRWFIGLGAGTQPSQIDSEKAFVEAYNGSQSDVYLQIEIIPNTTAADVLKTELQSPESAPDIIGPVGVEGLNLFSDQLLDMAPIIASTGYTPTGVDPALIDFFNSLGQNGATVGLPFAVYPSFIFYNKDLFDEAGLPYPPTQVGEQYDGAAWDLDALRTLAMKLTVDSAGNDATSADFDADNIVQWGFDSQYMDNYNLRAESAWFGTGPLLGDDGTAQIPDGMAAGAKWWNDGVWTDHFIPTANEVASDLLLAGSEFASGNLAIDEGHTWFTCCVTPPEGTAPFNFGFAVNPTVNGTITSPLHADTFSLLKTTTVPDAAFKAITAMVASGDLLTAYGAMPADQTKQQAWFDSIDAGFPDMDLDWSVAQAMLAYPDIPNHQSWVPDYAAVRSAMQAFGNKYRTTSGLDMDAELAALQVTLQGIFDAAQ